MDEHDRLPETEAAAPDDDSGDTQGVRAVPEASQEPAPTTPEPPPTAWTANPSAYWVAGLAQFQNGDYTKARQALERAVSIYPRYFEAWQLLANTFEEQGYLDHALLAAQRSAEIAVTNLSQAWDTLAAMLLARERWEQAIAVDRVLDIVDPARHAIICYRMAIAYSGLGDLDGAERLLRESIAVRVDLLDRALEETLLEDHHHWLIAFKLQQS